MKCANGIILNYNTPIFFEQFHEGCAYKFYEWPFSHKICDIGYNGSTVLKQQKSAHEMREIILHKNYTTRPFCVKD